jgi:hypothetical protein
MSHSVVKDATKVLVLEGSWELISPRNMSRQAYANTAIEFFLTLAVSSYTRM